MRVFLWLSAVILASTAHAQFTVTGVVVDSSNHLPLPFVTILANADTRFGTMTDIDGKFSLSATEPISNLKLSYVGYGTITVPVTQASNLMISMSSQAIAIHEVTIYPGVNPAHRIINNVVANRKQHDPERLPSFRYISYNKLYASVDPAGMRADSVNTISISAGGRPDRDTTTTPTGQIDTSSGDSSLIKFLESHYLFLMETVSERVFRKPDLSYERVIANRVAGLQKSTFFILATQLQSLDFYEDHFTLLDKNYLSPIARRSTGNYSFNIEDTTYDGADTVFIISFTPRKGTNFDGLKGLLYVNTSSYAIQSVLAEPAEASATRIRIQQNYTRIDGRQWFPTQLNTDFEMQNVAVNGTRMMLVGRTYLKNIELEPDLRRRDFGSVALDVDPKASKQDSILTRFRQDSLTIIEQNTYDFIDSLGKAEQLDRKLEFLRILTEGKVRLGPINLDITRLVGLNSTRGWWVGVGLETNDRLSPRFSLGGFVSYAFRAKLFEYDAFGTVNVWPRQELRLDGGYRKLLVSAGDVQFYHDRFTFLDQLLLSTLLPDPILTREWYGAIQFRALKYLSGRIEGKHGLISNSDDYLFVEQLDDVLVGRKLFLQTTVTASLKYAHKEKVVRTGTESFSLDTKYPVLWFNIERSLPDVWSSQLDYWRLSAKLSKSFLLKKLGTTSFQVTAGQVLGDAPYYCNFFVTGSTQRLSFIWIEQAFNTMAVNEFLSDRYLTARVIHDFGQLIFGKGKNAPGLKLTTAMAFGDLSNPEVHHGLTFKTMEKGYYESGLVLDRILRLRYFNALSIGFGVGAFYRYGPYTLDPWWRNVAVRLTVNAGM